MFFLLWAALLFSVRGSNADTGASVERQTQCYHGFCIILYEAEITAEAGLCVVIPCSFRTSSGFTTEHMVWYKCEPDRRCGDSDMIFHTNKNNKKVQSQFEGRVSLLQSDVSQNNCSIIINDLTVSDSGSYQLRVKGFRYMWSGSRNKAPEGFTFSSRPTVSVKDLTQKPTVMIPPLTKGQQTTLTCTAPGLCSGSDPTITWRWKGTEANDTHITGNITAENHSSTLTFNPSAELHGTNVTCKVSFTGDTTTEETVTLNVSLFPRILKNSGCRVQSEVLTCVCISEGLPLPTIKWPLLKHHTEYSVITTVSKHTVNCTVTLTVKDRSNTAVACVSSNKYGEVKRNLTIQVEQEDQPGPGAVLPWVVAALSLIVNVIFIICLVFLWNTRKKVKPNQEDRTYMSLRKKDLSPEYDVIGQPLN
ncbi:sialic acid-binding Ig-like lectin 12 isoform X2 [Sparus aurata]|uniref:sialic acid-binding Ig-like lectin 12 isoform X2 n=1 Tax=Sparus aurata TaxID=8175 RepID=UPI0011C12456|nr:sialic acid-binding Ig-like lectin 12 isoform X2 [Sparus aurata]